MTIFDILWEFAKVSNLFCPLNLHVLSWQKTGLFDTLLATTQNSKAVFLVRNVAPQRG
jgi:hypothetical protein